MLFVSRRIGPESFGVVDSETGLEETCTRSELIQRAFSTEIAGVTKIGKTISSIRPYQSLESKSLRQVKMHHIFGIRVNMYGDTITDLYWNLRLIRDPVALRLSYFGGSCADCIWNGNEIAERHIITVILDDEIDITERTFMADDLFMSVGPTCLGFMFDLREVQDLSRLFKIYKSLMTNDGDACLQYIIDDPKRKSEMQRLVYNAVFK